MIAPSPFPYAMARETMRTVLNTFQDADCLIRAAVAGSLCRRVDYVKDIELVVEPKRVEITQTDLFGATTSIVKPHPAFSETVLALGIVQKGKPEGRYMQIRLPEGIVLDLFIPDPVDFMRQYSIRVGSADYVRMVLAPAWNKKGWCGSDMGFRRIQDCKGTRTPDGKTKWICTAKNPVLPPTFETEESFFKWLGIEWLPPQRRNM